MGDGQQDQTLYELLESDRYAHVNDIRLSYRRLIEESFSIQDEKEKEARFHQLTNAWKVLCDEERRAMYDVSLDKHS